MNGVKKQQQEQEELELALKKSIKIPFKLTDCVEVLTFGTFGT